METSRPQWLHDLLSALAYTFSQHQEPGSREAYNDITRFLIQQHRNLPDYLQLPMKLSSLGFDLLGCAPQRFHSAAPGKRAQAVRSWKQSSLGFERDLIRYYESLATFALHSRPERSKPLPEPQSGPASPIPDQQGAPLKCEVAVVGSGPGGAITACLLAEAGLDVVLFEEGAHWGPDSCPPFSLAEMLQKYRNGGQTVAFGANKIAFVEGRCVGGGSEINSGLYHRAPEEILASWRRDFRVEDLAARELQQDFETCERDLSVSFLECAASAASLRLADGARALGWMALEVPRWFRQGSDSIQEARQSMSRTYIPRFQKAGGRLVSGTRVHRLRHAGSGWRLEAVRNKVRVETRAEHVFVACGAVQTPALLLRSGLGRNVGTNLNVHPTVKILSRFGETVNSDEMGVPVHQVKEFAPRLSFGCSISSRAYMSLGLLDAVDGPRLLSEEWPKMASYYAMIKPEGSGRVRLLPGFDAPLVSYQLTPLDRVNLADGLKKLSEMLLASGAGELFASVSRIKPIRSSQDIERLPVCLEDGQANLMTIHLFSSCPMGEDRDRCVTDSYGRVHGYENLYVADASLLCSAPGVNPQGTVMALVHRNARAFLRDL